VATAASVQAGEAVPLALGAYTGAPPPSSLTINKEMFSRSEPYESRR
jgi:hypothetical protein